MWTHREFCILETMVRQVNIFGDDRHDEFMIVREDGQTQGIFKSWAVPVIPFLERGSIKALEVQWPQIDTETIGSWTEQCRKQPLRLAESLEQARLYSWLIDRELAKQYYTEPLSDDAPTAIRQLVNRLHLAFGLMNPFYHLEALVSDPSWIGITDTQASSHAGTLDIVPFFLPAAFRDYVVADTLNWNRLDWETIRGLTKRILISAKCSSQKRVLLNLAGIMGVPPEHIVFATNVLQFIPARVGGKKDDPIATLEALNQLEAVVCGYQQPQDPIGILGDMNARIRFYNWLPLVEGEVNFQGLNWTYASTCDTSSLLLQTLVEHPEVWQEGFADVFNGILLPQLRDLDATSAKGRFLLHLILEERRLRKGIFDSVDRAWALNTLEAICSASGFGQVPNPTRTIYPHSLVGGKPHGLALAAYVLGEDSVLDGFVIPTTVVEYLLRRDNGSGVFSAILQLDQVSAVNQVRTLLSTLQEKVRETQDRFETIVEQYFKQFLEVERWAVRSSSFDEGNARGLHLTGLNVPRNEVLQKVVECIASYYSEKAVLFRVVTGRGSLPRFAVFLQPYLEGPGGVAEIRDSHYHVSCGSSADAVNSDIGEVHEYSCHLGDQFPDEIRPVVETLARLSEIYGDVQIEWAMTSGGLKIFQMERLISPDVPTASTLRQAGFTVAIGSVADMERTVAILQSSDALAGLVLGEINLDVFQGALFTLIAQCGNRIAEIRLSHPVSPSSHFANICRHFGIKLIP